MGISGSSIHRLVSAPPGQVHFSQMPQQATVNPFATAAAAPVPPLVPAMGCAVDACSPRPVYEAVDSLAAPNPLASLTESAQRTPVEPVTAAARRTARKGSITDDLFNLLDVDHDGVVTRQEFRAGLKKNIISRAAMGNNRPD